MRIDLKYSLPIVALCSLLFSSLLQAADIRVRIDRSLVEVNETFTLTFESSEAVDGDPDFSPLEKDFQILNQSTSSNISIINGNYTRSQRWNVTLMATREGTITIPSINFGSDVSPPYQITIKPVQQSSGSAGDEFISELVISTNTTYPQAQVIVTQRLLSSRNIAGYEFSKLKITGVDAAIEPLGEVKQYQTQRGGTPYLVLEQLYALFPQQAGTLSIQPSIASARVALNSARNPYDPFRSNTKTVRRASEKQTVTVKSIPTSFKGNHWLVANEVQLVEEFPVGNRFKVGEPITRTLSILVDGQSASQLPEFVIPEIDGLKQYPDQPLTNDNIADTGITGVQQIKVAIIPSREGSYTLPEISIPWWNLKTGKVEIARIQARNFTVGAGAATKVESKTDTASTEADITPTPPAIPADIDEPAPITQQATNESTSGSVFWKILSLLLLIAWLVTLYILWTLKRTQKPANQNSMHENHSLKSSYKKLQDACQNNDAQSCKVALLYWANALFDDQPVFSLGELAKRVDDAEELSQHISQLNTLLYKNTPEQWQADELLELVKVFTDNYQKETQDNNPQDMLEPLYK